jgi:hypothetical protein
VPAVEHCWCWAGGAGLTNRHFVEAADRVLVGVAGCVVGQPAVNFPLLDHGEGGAFQQGRLQAYFPHSADHAMSVGWMRCLPTGRKG